MAILSLFSFSFLERLFVVLLCYLGNIELINLSEFICEKNYNKIITNKLDLSDYLKLI